MNDKRAKDIMTTDVIVANKNDIIANVANLLIKEKIGGLLRVFQDRFPLWLEIFREHTLVKVIPL